MAAASLMVAGWAVSTAVAGADPDETRGPAPGPAPGASASPSPAASPAPSAPPAPAASPEAGPPPAGPKTSIDKDGIYAVGTDIAPGTYSSGGPVGDGTCYWKRTSNPDGALIDNAMTKKPQVVQIDPSDKSFKTSGCQPWQLSPDAVPPTSAPPASVQGTLGILNALLGGNGQRAPQAPAAPPASPAPQAPAAPPASPAPQAPAAPPASPAPQAPAASPAPQAPAAAPASPAPQAPAAASPAPQAAHS